MQMVTFSAVSGPVPTVSSVSPNSGSTAGGTAVTITRTNFVAGATVTFGGTAATNVVVVNSTTITATTPGGNAGAATVTVTNPGGQAGSLANGFTYVASPTVSSVSPNNGPVAGGTAVTITGTNFATGTTVTFGGTAATNVMVVSATQITATTPAGSTGAVTVTVTNPGVPSGSLANGFTYVVIPTITSISPNSGPIVGGTAVTITGTNFATGATVTLGGTAATNVVVVSGTQITATTPAGSAGAATVTVTVNGQSGSLANGFTYNVPVGDQQVAVSAVTLLPGATITAADLSRYGSQVVTDREGVPRLDQLVRWIEVDVPARFLPANVRVLDTPGLGALYAGHAQITLSYSPLHLGNSVAQELRIYNYTGGNWVPVSNQTIDVADHDITFTTDNLGYFILAVPEPSSFALAAGAAAGLLAIRRRRRK